MASRKHRKRAPRATTDRLSRLEDLIDIVAYRATLGARSQPGTPDATFRPRQEAGSSPTAIESMAVEKAGQRRRFSRREISDRIEQMRIARGLTAKQVYMALGMEKWNWSRKINTKVPFDLDDIARVAEFFEAPPGWPFIDDKSAYALQQLERLGLTREKAEHMGTTLERLMKLSEAVDAILEQKKRSD